MVDARFVQHQLQSTCQGNLFAAVTSRARVVQRTTQNSMRVFWRHEALYHIHSASASGAATLVD